MSSRPASMMNGGRLVGHLKISCLTLEHYLFVYERQSVSSYNTFLQTSPLAALR